MVEAPKVHCPKEGRKVSVWHCLGSFVEQRMKCPDLLEFTVKIAEDYAEVKCKAQKEEEKRGFAIKDKSAPPFTFAGSMEWLTLTELSIRLDGSPTKHILAVWDDGERKDL